MTSAIKMEVVINAKKLYRKRVRHSPETCREVKRGVERVESLFTALSLVEAFFPKVCYYRPSSWAPFSVELVHINLEVLMHRWTDWVAFTRELAGSH